MLSLVEQSIHFLRSHLGWVIAGLLLLFALFLTIAQDARDVFGRKTSTQNVGDLATLHLSYVDPMPVFTNSEGRTPLLIWISAEDADSDFPLTDEYLLYLTVREPGLTLLDLQEQPLGQRPASVAKELDNLGTAFYLAPTDVMSAFPPSALISVTVAARTIFTASTDASSEGQAPRIPLPLHKTFAVPLEMSTAFHPFSFLPLSFFAHELIALADTLALLLAVVVLLWEWDKWREEDRRREEERQSQENSRREDEMRREEERQIELNLSLQKSWLDGIVGLTAAIERLNGNSLSNEFVQSIGNLQRRYCTPGQQGRFLRESGARYRQDRDVAGLSLLLKSARCFGSDFVECLKPASQVLDDALPLESDNLVGAFKLWETYFYDVGDIILAVSLRAIEKNHDNAEKIIRDELKYPGRKWLGLLPGLREYMSVPLDIYTWPSFKIPHEGGRQKSEQSYLSYLKTNDFSHDPFTSIRDQSGILFDLPPTSMQWFHNSWTSGPSINIAELFEDNVTCAESMFLQVNKNHNIFPIIGISDQQPSVSFDTRTWLDSLCRIVAEWWLQLLAANPNGFLALTDKNQGMLFDMLLWFCGSVEIIEQRLGIAGSQYESHLLSGAPTLEHLLKIYLELYKIHRSRIEHPVTAQYVEWLNIRPPGRDFDTHSTVIFEVLPPTLQTSWVNGIEFLSQRLSERRIYLHIFCVRASFESTSRVIASELMWTPAEIRETVDSRIAHCSSFRWNSFEELTTSSTHSAWKADEYLQAAARGSLNRALEFCRTAIQEHQRSSVRSMPAKIDESTLKIALEKVNRETP